MPLSRGLGIRTLRSQASDLDSRSMFNVLTTVAGPSGRDVSAWASFASRPRNEEPLLKDLIEDLNLADWAEIIVGLAIVAVAALVSYFVVRRLIAPVVRRLVLKTERGWDYILLDNAVLHRVALFAPMIVVLAGMPQIPSLASGWVEFIERVSGALLILFVVLAISALMTAAANLYATLPIAADHPIKVYLQIARIAMFVVGGVVIVARLADQSPFFFLSSIGALMAVILLIFRDTILSFVASLQLASNDMVRVGGLDRDAPFQRRRRRH